MTKSTRITLTPGALVLSCPWPVYVYNNLGERRWLERDVGIYIGLSHEVNADLHGLYRVFIPSFNGIYHVHERDVRTI